jgi:hypothetical protein
MDRTASHPQSRRIRITLSPETYAALTRWRNTPGAGADRSQSEALRAIIKAYLGVTCSGMPGFGVGWNKTSTMDTAVRNTQQSLPSPQEG